MPIAEPGRNAVLDGSGRLESHGMTLCSMNACSAPDFKSGQRLRRSIENGASAGVTPRRCPDIGTMRAIRSAPSVSVVRGIARRVAWYRENPAPTETNPLL